jgi:hypothetical protein
MSWQSTTKSPTRGSLSWKPGLAMFRLDYLSCFLTVSATILVGRKSWTGLLISIVNSLVVCIIGVRTSQFGLIPANLFCVCVYAFSIRSWLRTQRDREQAPPPVAVRSRTAIDQSCTRVAHGQLFRKADSVGVVQVRPTPFTATHPHNRRIAEFQMNQEGTHHSGGAWTNHQCWLVGQALPKPPHGQRGKNKVKSESSEVNCRLRRPGVHSSTQHAQRGRFSFQPMS